MNTKHFFIIIGVGTSKYAEMISLSGKRQRQILKSFLGVTLNAETIDKMIDRLMVSVCNDSPRFERLLKKIKLTSETIEYCQTYAHAAIRDLLKSSLRNIFLDEHPIMSRTGLNPKSMPGISIKVEILEGDGLPYSKIVNRIEERGTDWLLPYHLFMCCGKTNVLKYLVYHGHCHPYQQFEKQVIL